VTDLRIYRAALLPATCALVVVMFALETRPAPIHAQLSPDNFDSGRAVTLAKSVLKAGPARTPGGSGDSSAADLVREHFSSVAGGTVSEQSFAGSFKGKAVTLRNVVLVLPGDSERRVVLIAHRDSAEGPGAASSASATGALLEIADDFGGLRHRKTLVFVSTDAGSTGAVGAREFADGFPGRNLIDAAIVLSAPGVRQPRQPFLSPWSTDDRSTSTQLVRSAAASIAEQVGQHAETPGAFGHMVRLAFPSGLGEAAVLIAAGVDAIQITGSGERPPPLSADRAGSISTPSLDRFGRATLSMLLALDEAEAPLIHGPDAYVTVGGNLIPGWSLALLALALLLPVGAASVNGLARAARRREPVALHVAWVASRSMPFLLTLAALYVISFVGWIPRPGWPFDPGAFPLRFGGISAFVFLAMVFTASWVVLRPLRLPPLIGGDGIAAAIGLTLFLLTAGVWFIDPYLALLMVPTVHLWAAGATPRVRARPGSAAMLVVAGIALPVIATAYLAQRLGVGVRMPWELTLMVTGGQVGLPLAVLGCLLGGCLVALAALVWGARTEVVGSVVVDASTTLDV
jgi:hypothetical protein